MADSESGAAVRPCGPAAGLLAAGLFAAGLFAAAPIEEPAAAADPLAAGFRNPPAAARPSAYWLWLNGCVNREYLERELRAFKDAGIRGLCLFDMGARGPAEAVPPAGPAFLSEAWLRSLAHAVRIAGELGIDVELSVASSWDMGGAWVEPRHASMGLYHVQWEVTGPAETDRMAPFPPVPAKAPRRPDGHPAFWKDVAVLAIPAAKRRPGHEFIFRLDPPGLHALDRVVLYNARSPGPGGDGPSGSFAEAFSVDVSTTDARERSFREVLRASLRPATGPQRFPLRPRPKARFVRLRILAGHDPRSDRVALAEFEVWSTEGINVVASHAADRTRDGAVLIARAAMRGSDRSWTAANIHDGAKTGPHGTWSSAGPPPLLIDDPGEIVDLTDRIDADGRLRWTLPPGRWSIVRFVCMNTGERLKVPSPASDGLATDHLSAAATRHCLQHVIERLQRALGSLGRTALTHLYLASYEVRGPIWTPDFTEQFRRYRGYDMTRYLPALAGCRVGGEAETERFLYDYRKTLGDLLVDAYYRTARETAHRAGLRVESEAGGPGPPIHNVPVDALKALGAVDAMRGEFWPKRPQAHRLWVVKETACAAHIYGRRRVHVEAFTSMHHWQDGPFDLKPSADRAFCEGANHFVWHTAAHSPPEAGRPGWAYGAGTHLNPNLAWWPFARPFLDYLARCSFLLGQGLFVADVCYYYGDQGFNFVPPKHVDPSLGFGYDYDVTNAEALLARMRVRGGDLVLPDGMRYALLALPDRPDIDLDVLRRIEQWVREGATVVGPRPARSTGLADFRRRDAEVRRLAGALWGPCDGRTVLEHGYGKGRVVWGRRLREVLARRGIGADFRYTVRGGAAELDFIHRRTARADIYFVRNKTMRRVAADAVFRVRGKAPEIWLPDRGAIRPHVAYRTRPEGVEVPLWLAPAGSLFVVFRRPVDAAHVVSIRPAGGTGGRAAEAPARGRAASPPLPPPELLGPADGALGLLCFAPGPFDVALSDGRTRRVGVPGIGRPRVLAGPWRVRFSKGWGAPASATFPKLISWTEHPDEGIRYYAGVAAYERAFSVPRDWLGPGRRVFLDLGGLWAAGEVHVNGRHVGIAWKPPYRVDVTAAVRPGANRLLVKVANTWSNRLVGDARGAGGRRYCRTNIRRTGGLSWAETPLHRSGLFGPVRLLPAAVVPLGRRGSSP